MFKRLVIDKTTNNSIRVWMYFNEEDVDKVRGTKDYNLFQLLSIWGGYDNKLDGMFSWELPLSLEQYLNERYAFSITNYI